MLPLPANSIAVPPAADDGAGVEDADRMGALDLDAGRAGDHAEVGNAAGEGRPGDVDRGLARENLARAVDQDAVARRLDGAAVDDRAGDGAREQGDAGLRRDRAGIDDTAHDARNAERVGGRLAEFDADMSGADRAPVAEAAQEGSTPRTTMPSLCAKGSPFATITLALMMAPAMVSAWTTMPFAADIVPLLTTLPLALVLPSTVALLLLLIAMPVPEVAVILPLSKP